MNTDNYSIYAVSEDGTETVDFASTKEDANILTSEYNEMLANGSYVDQTSLGTITHFEYDQLG